jgi:hypothetical protein
MTNGAGLKRSWSGTRILALLLAFSPVTVAIRRRRSAKLLMPQGRERPTDGADQFFGGRREGVNFFAPP